MTSLKSFIFQYRFNEVSWVITVPAHSIEEAKERVKAMSQAEYVGEESHQHYLQG